MFNLRASALWLTILGVGAISAGVVASRSIGAGNGFVFGLFLAVMALVTGVASILLRLMSVQRFDSPWKVLVIPLLSFTPMIFWFPFSDWMLQLGRDLGFDRTPSYSWLVGALVLGFLASWTLEDTLQADSSIAGRPDQGDVESVPGAK